MVEIDEQAEANALVEISSTPLPIRKNVISEYDAEKLLHDTYAQLVPAAKEVCTFVEEQDLCWWDVNYNDERTFNAYATSENTIVVYHDIMAVSDTTDEVAMVLAHEMAHHIADHINEAKNRQAWGAFTGALLVAAAVNSNGSYYCDYNCQRNRQDAVNGAAQLGAAVGRISFSKKQEKEADMIAAYILARSGYDVAQSRNLLLKMGAMSTKKKTGFFDTHPAGPERLATYDQVIRDLLIDPDRMPDKKK
ncbi:MAG: M48 family metalloprotease [Halieaceae bacterium]